MRQQITLEQWDELSDNHKEFIKLWKKRKKYLFPPLVTLGECIELLIGISFNLHHEESDGRFYNHILQNMESLIAWDGAELIDILWFEVIKQMKKQPVFSQTFNEEVTE